MHFNQLSPAQAERLALLAEECSEVVQIVCKILRHGMQSRNPGVMDSHTNRMELEIEVGHVLAAIDFMVARLDINEESVEDSKILKKQDVTRWLHHN